MASDDPVTTISESLKETDDLPRKQIAEIVGVLGPEEALALLAETRRVQDEGGVEVRDGTRRRTDGGVFFSLAKAKLPKSDRNRIFRVRVQKAPGAPDSEDGRESEGAGTTQSSRGGSSPAGVAQKSPSLRGSEPQGPGGPGRRRIVEVEVLRHFGKPGAREPLRPERGWAPPREAEPPKDPALPLVGSRPLRRIVTVGPAKSEPPTTPASARERVRDSLKSLSSVEKKSVLSDMLREMGGVIGSEPKYAPPPAKNASSPEPQPGGIDGATRERILAAVTDALGLTSGDLAKVLFGEDSASTKAKARIVLERFRRS